MIFEARSSQWLALLFHLLFKLLFVGIMSKFFLIDFRRLFAFMGISICIFSLRAQNIDQLEAKLLKATSNEDRIEICLTIADKYLPQEPNEAAIWVDQAVETTKGLKWTEHFERTIEDLYDALGAQNQLAERKKYLILSVKEYPNYKNFKLYLNSLYGLGMDCAKLGEADTAKLIFEQMRTAIEEQSSDSENYPKYLLEYYSGKGVVHAIGNDLTKAVSSFILADSIALLHGSVGKQMDCKYMLGSAFIALGRYQEGAETLRKVEEYFLNGNKEYYNISATYNNLANAYNMLDSNDLALSYLTKNLNIARNANDSTTVGFVFLTRGLIYKSMNKEEEAIENFEKAALAFSVAKSIYNYNDTRTELVQIWLSRKENLPKAREIAQELASFYAESENNTKLSLAFQLIAMSEYGLENYKSAYENFAKYDSINNLVQAENYSNLIVELETKYQTKEHKRESEKQAGLALIEKQKNQDKNLLLLVIGGAATLLLLILIALMALYNRLQQSRNLVNDQKEKIEKREKEKSILLKELHHRVKNNLQIVSSLLHLQSENVKEASAIGAFKDGQNRVEAMAMIHHYLYSTDELTTLEVDKYFTQLTKSITYSYGYQQDEVDLSFDITSKAIDVDLAIPLGLIANELISNSFKHAYKEVERPMLKLELKLEEDLTLIIADNGPGMGDKPLESHNGSFGMDLIQSLTKQLKAELKYRQTNGSRFELIIPKSTLKKKN